MIRRGVIALVLVALASACLVVVGRWEQRREVAHEVRGMRAVLAAIGPLDQVGATGYRIGPPDCLAYPVQRNALGLQICFDRDGTIVETVDRRPHEPTYSSLAYDPSLSPLHGSPARLRALLAAAYRESNGRP